MHYSGDYNWLGRALHQLAFATPLLQRILGELETDLFSRRLKQFRSEQEVFVTGLPRAGTTLLLEMLYRTGEFETFTYRHMPFVLMPLLWSRISRTDRRVAAALPRAHDDGMSISIESPEAFEEVVWLAYQEATIVCDRHLEPLTTASPECVDALKSTICKLLADSAGGTRYLSKNNANISRLELLSRLFPSSTIFVVFRDPAAHVASLCRQHRRFSMIHTEDRFARRYMKWIGHYEFGANLRPINFSGWLDGAGEAIDGSSEEFWLRYWTEAYRYALEHRTPNVVFVDFDRLLLTGRHYLAALARVVELRVPPRLTAQAEFLRTPHSGRLNCSDFGEGIWKEASDIHACLRDAAIKPGPSLALAG